MSTQQSSSIRVKGSKNPWNKKKNKKPNQSTNDTNNITKKKQQKQQSTHSVSQINDTEQWPDLQLGAKMNISTAPKKATEAIIISPKSLSNHNNTGSSTPNIKYKSNQNQENQTNIKTELNGYNTNSNNTDSISNKVQSPQNKQTKSNTSITPNQHTKITSNTNPNSTKSNKSNASSKSIKISTDNLSIKKSNKAQNQSINSTKSSSISTDTSNSNTNDQSTSNSPKKPKKRKRRSKAKSNSNNNTNTQKQAQQIQSNPANTSSKSSSISTDSSIAISPQNDNKNTKSNQQQQPQQNNHTQTNNNISNGNNPTHNTNNDLPPRSYHSFSRRPNRGKRRGRGRGGAYRNNYYEDDQSQSSSNSGGGNNNNNNNNNNNGNNNNYQRNSYRNNYRNNNNRRPSYRGSGGPAPRHNRDRHRNNNNNNNNNNNSNQYNNDQFNNTNATLWNQPHQQFPNGMYMAIPVQPFIPIQPYPIQTIGAAINATSIQSPRGVDVVDNKDNNNNNNAEADTERKSDTTTTTSNSTIPNGNNSNSNNTTPTPGIGGIGGIGNNNTATATATATTPSTIGSTPQIIPNMGALYSPYTFNPYLMGMGLASNINMMINTEPPEHIHLSINQMQKPPQWNGEIDLPMGPYFVLKVSCVATGYGADDRSVGHIALIDWNLKTKANVFVKPEQEITSYIEPLTSLNKDLLDKYGYPLDKAINIIKSELPTNAVLIGQNITMDLQWLGFKQNMDFRSFIDLRDIWRSWSEYYKSYTHYSLIHQSKCILNVANAETQKHSASYDAITTMKLFQYYLWCRYYNMQLFHNKINILQTTKIPPSFAKKNPVFEGVQMQIKKYKGVPYITAKPKNINKDNINQNDDHNDINNNDNDKKPKQTIFIDPPKSLDAAKAE